MEEAEPQQRRRLDPPPRPEPLPTLAGAVRKLDGTGANGPRRPPRGGRSPASRREARFMPVPEGTSSGRTHRKTGLPRPNRLVTPSSAHCTALPASAWQRAIASALNALASSISRQSCARAAAGLGGCWTSIGGHVSRSARIAHAPKNQSRSASTRRGRFTPREGPFESLLPEFRCSGCHRLIHVEVLVLLDNL
jgi:hypothetical protein